MKFTIINIRNLEVYDRTTKNWTVYPGYAFLDEDNKTIIQCYGDGKRVLIEKYLKDGK